MNNEGLNTALYEKMSAEQDKFRDWLLTQPPEEILKHTYEYTVREDILMTMEELNLSDGKAAALLSSPSPLGDIFSEYGKLETDYMDTIRDCIESRANDALGMQRELPIYQHSSSYAQEHGELDAYFESHKANVACRDAIVQAISTHYHDNSLDSREAVQEVFGQFGADRTLYVLAATVQEKNSNGRFSWQNKEWAKTVPVAPDTDAWGQNRNLAFVVDAAHPGLVDLFVNRAKREYVQEQNRDTGKSQKEKASRKPSIKGQLATPPVPGDKPPIKSREEAR